MKIEKQFLGLCLPILASAPRAVAAEPANQVVIAFGSLSERKTPLFVGQDYGIFGKHGSDIRPVHARNGAGALSVLVSGDQHP
jgi:ABC-type nitrate/sulfonate/bicarbonate transport system substrate-binding protein